MERHPFPLADHVPEALRGIILDFHWELDRLWALDLPVAEVAVAELSWQLELPFWADGDRFFAVTPRQVAAEPDRYAGQFARTRAADLGEPIHLLDRGGRLTVLDGVHRLLKAELEGRPTIAAKKVGESHFDDIARRGDPNASPEA